MSHHISCTLVFCDSWAVWRVEKIVEKLQVDSCLVGVDKLDKFGRQPSQPRAPSNQDTPGWASHFTLTSPHLLFISFTLACFLLFSHSHSHSISPLPKFSFPSIPLHLTRFALKTWLLRREAVLPLRLTMQKSTMLSQRQNARKQPQRRLLPTSKITMTVPSRR